MGKLNLIDLLNLVNVPGCDNGIMFLDPTRRNIIEKLVEKETEYSVIADNGYVMLCNCHDDHNENVILISCHIDHPFDDEGLFIEVNGNKITGTLDNSASIACLLKYMMNYITSNVYITFTGDEEGDGCGSIETIEYLKSELPQVYERLSTIISLDVSPDNYSQDISIENIDSQYVDEINELLSNDINAGYLLQEESEPDESCRYREVCDEDINVFSLCLPIENECYIRDECRFDLCNEGQSVCHCNIGTITTIAKMKSMVKALELITS